MAKKKIVEPEIAEVQAVAVAEDFTFDQLNPGDAAQAADILPIERSGLNYYLTVSAISAFVNANLNAVQSVAVTNNTLLKTGTATNPSLAVNTGTGTNQIPQLDANGKMPDVYGGTMKASDSWGRATPLVTSIDTILASYANQIPITPGAILELEMTGDESLNPYEPLPLIIVAQPTADGQKITLPTIAYPGQKVPLSIGQQFSVININENNYNLIIEDNNLTALQTIKPFEMYRFIMQDNTTIAGEFIPIGEFLFPSSPTRGILTGVVTFNTDDIDTSQTAVNKFLNPQTILQTPDAYVDSRLDKVITDTQLMNLNGYSTALTEEWNADDERILCPINYSQGGIFTFFILTSDSVAGASRFGITAQVSFGDCTGQQYSFNILSYNSDGNLFATLNDFLQNFSFNVYRLNTLQGLFTIKSAIKLPTNQGFLIYSSLNAGNSFYQSATPFIGQLIANLPFPISSPTAFTPQVFATESSGAQEEFTWTPVDATGTVTFPLAIGRGVKRGNEVELFCTVQYPTTSSSQYVQINGWNTSLNPGDNNNAGICITTTASSSSNNYPNGVTTLSDRLSLRCNGAVVPLSAVSGQRFNCKISYWLDN